MVAYHISIFWVVLGPFSKEHNINFETFLGFVLGGSTPILDFSHPKLESLRVSIFCSFYFGRGGELEEEEEEEEEEEDI